MAFFLLFLILSTVLAFRMLGSLRKAQFVRVLAGFVDIMSRNNLQYPEPQVI